MNCGGNHVSRSSDCDTTKNEKEVMKIKVTQRLTYPEARKVYDQQTPEFTFSKIVSPMPKKPETKTTSTQYSEKDSESTKSSRLIIAHKPTQNQNNQNSTSKSASEKQTTQRQQNQTNTKQGKQIVILDRIRKGSDDPVQNHNRFGPLADDGVEGTMRPAGGDLVHCHWSGLQRSSVQSLLF